MKDIKIVQLTAGYHLILNILRNIIKQTNIPKTLFAKSRSISKSHYQPKTYMQKWAFLLIAPAYPIHLKVPMLSPHQHCLL